MPSVQTASPLHYTPASPSISPQSEYTTSKTPHLDERGIHLTAHTLSYPARQLIVFPRLDGPLSFARPTGVPFVQKVLFEEWIVEECLQNCGEETCLREIEEGTDCYGIGWNASWRQYGKVMWGIETDVQWHRIGSLRSIAAFSSGVGFHTLNLTLFPCSILPHQHDRIRPFQKQKTYHRARYPTVLPSSAGHDSARYR